jgi:hypothetical protein
MNLKDFKDFNNQDIMEDKEEDLYNSNLNE